MTEKFVPYEVRTNNEQEFLSRKPAIFAIKNLFHRREIFRAVVSNTRKFSSALQEGVKYFTDKHEWVSLIGKTATVGVSNYAQEALGDIVYVQLPDVDTEVNQLDECGAIESVKSASELYSPLSGTIVEVNSLLEQKPELINSDCLGQGWLFKLRVKNPDELESLMSEEQYNTFLKTEKNSHS